MRNSIVQIVTATFLSFSGTALCVDLSGHETTCLDIGFEKQTPAFGECVPELDRRFMDQQKQAKGTKQQKTSEAAMRGDGTPDHDTCYRYGFRPETTPYAECRLKIGIARTDAEQRQAAYEADNLRYQEQVTAIETEKERRKYLKIMELDLRLMGGASPQLAENVGNGGVAIREITPIRPRPPSMENYTITMPGGRIATCIYDPSMRVMNCQ